MTDQNQTITPQEALIKYACKWINPVAAAILNHADEYLSDPTLCEILVQWATIRTTYEEARAEKMRAMLCEDCTWVDSSNIVSELDFLRWDDKKANSYSDVLDHFIFEPNSKAE